MTNFSNREIAIGIWILIVFAWLMQDPKIRNSVGRLLRAFMSKVIIVSSALMVTYVTVMIIGLSKVGLWDKSFLKETIFWILGVGSVQLFSANKANQEARYFSPLLLDQLKWVAVLEFVVEFYSFNLLVELAFVPLLVLLGATNAYAETKEEYRSVKKLTNVLMILIGLMALLFSLYKVAVDAESLLTLDNFRLLILFPVMTALYLPFLYIVALYMAYESITWRWTFFNKDDPAFVKWAKWKLLQYGGVNLKKVNGLWDGRLKLLNVKTKQDVEALLKN